MTLPRIDERAGLPSGSSIFRAILCPPSFLEEQKAGERDSSEYATIGRTRHAWMEDETHMADIPEEDRPAIIKARALRKMAIESFHRSQPEPLARVSPYKEMRLWAKVRNLRVGSGQLDEFYIGFDAAGVPVDALIVDYKMMYKDYGPAEDNEQLEFYSVLVADFVKAEFDVFPLHGVLCALVQPLCRDNKLTLVRRSMQELEESRAIYYKACAEARKPTTRKHNPGYRQCEHCRALMRCEAHYPIMSEILAIDIDNATNQELEDLLVKCGPIETKIAQIKDLVKARLADPESAADFTRFKLESSGYDTRFTDGINALNWLRSIDMEHYIEEATILKHVNITPNALADAYSESAGIGDKEAKEFVLAECSSFVIKKKKADSLKPVVEPKKKKGRKE